MLRDRAETELGSWVRPLQSSLATFPTNGGLQSRAPTLREKANTPVSAPPPSLPPSQPPADIALSSITDTQTEPSDGGIHSVTRLGLATPSIEQTRWSQRAVKLTTERQDQLMHRCCSYRDGSCGRPDDVRGMGAETGSEKYIAFQGLHSEAGQDCEAAYSTDDFRLRILEHDAYRRPRSAGGNLQRSCTRYGQTLSYDYIDRQHKREVNIFFN